MHQPPTLESRARKQHRSVAQEVTKILEDALKSPDLVSIQTVLGLGKEKWAGIAVAGRVESERKSQD